MLLHRSRCLGRFTETRSVKDIGSCIGVTALLYSTDISRARYEARGSGAGRSSQLLLSSAKCSRLSAAAQPREAGSSEGSKAAVQLHAWLLAPNSAPVKRNALHRPSTLGIRAAASSRIAPAFGRHPRLLPHPRGRRQATSRTREVRGS